MRNSVAFVTYILCIAIAVCTLAAWAVPGATGVASNLNMPMPPFLTQFAAMLQPVSADGGPWQLVSYMFLHASLPHFLCNIASLFYIGTMVERLYGHGRMLVGFLVSGVAGGAAFRFVHMTAGDVATCVGASGAIFGLMGMYALFLLAELLSREPYFINKSVAASLLASVAGVLAINIFVSFTPGIAWEAHFGGLAAGILCAVVMLWQMRARARADRQVAGSRYMPERNVPSGRGGGRRW